MTVTSERFKGTANIDSKLLPDGRKYISLTMNLRDEKGTAATVRQESVYAPDGSPARKLQVTTLRNQQARQSVAVTFEGRVAKVRVEQAGKVINQDYPAPKDGSLRNLAEFWVIRDNPASGAEVNYLEFDTNELAWLPRRAVFQGRRTIKIAGKDVQAFLITYGDARAYLDAKGDPLRLESGGTVMERAAR